ncbi:hypothetical protein KUTeg_025010 [Tegillarca granosa]|uniref:tRNA (carboxymethyluridine(34)-5-O)-methyltransferase n=1 Tax=Tegillarca granosa TaxID=220873 RepID=A0ABQ9DZI5_TEGGR|nr:hypothetical protein KUTeg_025010 [Tegillarca granosa]
MSIFDHPGPDSSYILCVNNAGLDNGMSVDEVDSIFSPYGELDDIILLPQKPYAFVCFSNTENALEAYNNLNGFQINPTEKRPTTLTLYIFFVSKVPSYLCPSSELPPGLIPLEDFISPEYSQELLKFLDFGDKQASERELKHRQVKHFGYEFKYGINDVDADDPLPQGIPEICKDLLDKALKTGHIQFYPDQLTVNRYLPGQGIPPHVDTPAAFEDGLMALSLGSQVVMDFRHPNGKHLSVMLPPNSLLIMTKESRYVWSHGITPRKSDIISTDKGLTVVKRDIRTSFTFRKIIHPKDRIHRTIPNYIDNENSNKQINESQSNLPKSEQEAEELEKLHVHKVYEEIADHFSGTRHTAWPRISNFLMSQPAGSLVADIGCGNGKYLGVNKNIYMVGSDRSMNLIQICKERKYEAFVGDILSVPIKSEILDVCICIAVIHHLSTQERRKNAVKELLRVVRPGGKVLIYVWAMEQELHNVKSKYLRECKIPAKADFLHSESSILSNSIDCQQNIDKCNHTQNSLQYDFDSKCDVSSSDHDGNRNDCQFTSIEHDGNGDSCHGTVSIESDSSKSNESKKLHVHTNRTQFKQQDLLVPWQLKSKDKSEMSKEEDKNTFHRYYHVFKKDELETMCQSLNCCKVIDSYYDQGNWAVTLEKT